MQKASGILEQISGDETLVEQIRLGDLQAFEKLNLSFDELYASAQQKEDEFLGTAVCLATCHNFTCAEFSIPPTGVVG